MKVAVTGARGFIGRRVVSAARAEGHEVLCVARDVATSEAAFASIRSADAVIHLAGVNRPKHEGEFTTGNADLTQLLANALDCSTAPIVVFSSSSQATLDNAYGRSKRAAEESLERAAGDGARVAIFRLPGVFGPGARPNYNSVAATFAHASAAGLPLEVHDAARQITLVYVHDVAAALVAALSDPPRAGTFEQRHVEPEYRVTLGQLADIFRQFGQTRETFAVPDVSSDFAKRLYATYLSYLPERTFSYDLHARSDDRGALAEFLKSGSAGQLFVSRTKPGVTRGNHFHHTKTEKFLVLEGDADVRFRPVDGSRPAHGYRVSGTDFRVIDIPPDYTHSIQNVGATELIVLFWASEIFDPDAPDTYPLPVQPS